MIAFDYPRSLVAPYKSYDVVFDFYKKKMLWGLWDFVDSLKWLWYNGHFHNINLTNYQVWDGLSLS